MKKTASALKKEAYPAPQVKKARIKQWAIRHVALFVCFFIFKSIPVFGQEPSWQWQYPKNPDGSWNIFFTTAAGYNFRNIGIGNETPIAPISFANIKGNKISLWNNGETHFGLGIQAALFQIYSDRVGSDIAFGYGSSTNFFETVRIKGNGNIGIGTINPGFPLNFANKMGDKISFWGISGINYGIGIQQALLQMHTDVKESDIAFGYGSSAAFNETMRIKGNGNVGIGRINPDFPLSFSDKMGDKIALCGHSGSHYGLGVQNYLLQVHSDVAESDIAFGYGSSAVFHETMRIKGNGNVGIGISNPTEKLTIAGDAVNNTPVLFLSPFSVASGSTYGMIKFGTSNHSIKSGYPAGMEFYDVNAMRLTTSNTLSFGTDNYKGNKESAELMTIQNNGNIGIGTTNPGFPLTFGATHGDKISFWGDNGINYGVGVQPALLQIHTDKVGSDIAFGYGSSAVFTETMRIKGNGNVGISTKDPGSFKLAVEGKLGAREIEVKIGAWPDFVFNKTYPLKSLQEVENFISIHKHLPDIPSEEIVKKEGINLGNMNALLLQKIEELTLYVIDQDKRIRTIEKENMMLKEKLHQH